MFIQFCKISTIDKKEIFLRISLKMCAYLLYFNMSKTQSIKKIMNVHTLAANMLKIILNNMHSVLL